MPNHAVIQQYIQDVKRANTEEAKKTLFYLLLSKLFKADTGALSIIQQMASGAEKTIFNIPKAGRTKTGRADTQYRQVIIEFENDIKNTAKREHAEHQLKEYFVGNLNSGNHFDFYLIATDCVRWNIYGAKPESYLNKTHLKPDEIDLKVVDNFVLSEANVDHFFGFIDRYLFRSGKQQPTLEHVQIDFGDSSSLFMEVFAAMKLLYSEIDSEPEIQTAYREWDRFMSVAYGSFQASGEVFLVHTYLSVFAKLIAYEVISRDTYIDTNEMRGAIDGSIFERYNVENFVEKDFYQWITVDKYFIRLSRYFNKIADKISEYDFSSVRSDILKGVYQHLIDLETRHTLGEYYTPDWLCEKIVSHFEFERNAQILDPSCGSGSFLIASVNRLRQLYPDITPEELSGQVAGIDIHPLSVQVAKTTLLLSLGESVKHARRPISLRIYLANSLLTPQLSTLDLFGNFSVTIDEKRHYLPNDAFDDPTLFDHAVSVADILATDTVGEAPIPSIAMDNSIRSNYPNVSQSLVNKFYDIYLALKRTKEEGRDSIWRFILQNIYKPFFLRKRFDYIVGNPPWFTYNSIKNAEYQQLLKTLAIKYSLIPEKRALMPQLEIAAIFMSHVTSYLLRDGGKLAFVVPRSFLTAAHHSNTRSGSARGFRLTEVWDLKGVNPLFNIPSCVLFAKQANISKSIDVSGIPGNIFTGNVGKHNTTLTEIAEKLNNLPTQWYVAQHQNTSALTNLVLAKNESLVTTNFYKEHFRNGATMFPRNFYFVRPEGVPPNDWHNRVIAVRSDNANDKDAKMPWKELKLSGRIHSQFLFRTALARNIIPFGLVAPPLVVLPLQIQNLQSPEGKLLKRLRLLDYKEIQLQGFIETARWFKEVESIWSKNRTQNNAKTTSVDYLNWQHKLTEQNLDRTFWVLYSSSAKDANAFVFRQGSLDLQFLVENTAYVFETDDEQEAYFLTTFLNSARANISMKPFQAEGLFGARHVHKKILDVPLPQFKGENATHIRLAELGQACAKRVSEFIQTRNLESLTYNVGRIRSEIRNKLLTQELHEIDELLIELIGTL